MIMWTTALPSNRNQRAEDKRRALGKKGQIGLYTTAGAIGAEPDLENNEHLAQAAAEPNVAGEINVANVAGDIGDPQNNVPYLEHVAGARH
jgi:hypothetical protein